MTEPQWLPPPAKTTESSLKRFEDEQREFEESLRESVLGEAPDPIGVAGSDEHKEDSMSDYTAEVHDLLGSKPRVSFFEKYAPSTSVQEEDASRLSTGSAMSLCSPSSVATVQSPPPPRQRRPRGLSTPR